VGVVDKYLKKKRGALLERQRREPHLSLVECAAMELLSDGQDVGLESSQDDGAQQTVQTTKPIMNPAANLSISRQSRSASVEATTHPLEEDEEVHTSNRPTASPSYEGGA
jgi:hypothetical protein